MANCPYPTHQGIGPDIADEFPISFCKESCLRTFFRCPNCREANRPLALFCRRCSEPVSFDKVEANSVLPFQNGSDEIGRCKLSDLGIKEVDSLLNFRGHLLLDCDSSVVILDLHKVHEPLLVFASPDGRAVRGSTPVPSAEEPRLLITTSTGVYELNLLNPASHKVLYKIDANDSFIYHRAFNCKNQTYLLEHDSSVGTSRLVSLPDETVVTFPKFSSPPLVISDSQILLAVGNRVIVYHPEDGSLVEKVLPEPLVDGVQPAYLEELNMAFFVGQTQFWRCEVTRGELTFSPLSVRAFGDPRIAATRDQLIVARSKGILILDAFGGIKWNSEDNFITAPSDGRPPQVYKNYFAFTSPGSLGGSSIRLHPLNNPKEFELISFNKRLLCPPLLSLGHLCAAVGDEESIELVIK